MSSAAGLMTAEALWCMPKDGMRRMVVEGELRTMSPAGFEHGAVGTRFLRLIAQFVAEHNLGEVVGADTGFVLSRDPDTVRSPDVAFVRHDRLPNPLPVKFWEGPPDLAVEVVSPSDTVYEVEETVEAWLAGGTREVLVIIPRQRTIRVAAIGREDIFYRMGQTLEGLATVPGFRCELAAIFR